MFHSSFFLFFLYVLSSVDPHQQLQSIKYLEDKFYKSKSDVTKKLMERRREDVRDQMKELSLSSKPPLMMNPQESAEEEARQRRAAEREVIYLVLGPVLEIMCVRFGKSVWLNLNKYI